MAVAGTDTTGVGLPGGCIPVALARKTKAELVAGATGTDTGATGAAGAAGAAGAVEKIGVKDAAGAVSLAANFRSRAAICSCWRRSVWLFSSRRAVSRAICCVKTASASDCGFGFNTAGDTGSSAVFGT